MYAGFPVDMKLQDIITSELKKSDISAEKSGSYSTQETQVHNDCKDKPCGPTYDI